MSGSVKKAIDRLVVNDGNEVPRYIDEVRRERWPFRRGGLQDVGIVIGTAIWRGIPAQEDQE